LLKRPLAQEIDLIHQTVSPRERVGSGDETNSGLPCHSKWQCSTQISSFFVWLHKVSDKVYY